MPTFSRLGAALAALLVMAPISGQGKELLSCDNIRHMMQSRTGINLWTNFPNVVFVGNDKEARDLFKSITQDDPIRLWRYLNHICDSCQITYNNNPDIFILPIVSFQDLGDRLEIYTPEGLDHDGSEHFLQQRFDDHVRVFTSLNLIDRGFSPARQLTIISLFKDALKTDSIRDQLMIAYYEAIVDVKFWLEPSLRMELAQEIRSGCLSNPAPSCRVLEFGRFLYYEAQSFHWHGLSTSETMQDLCKRYLEH